jgi:hypothetical protein
VREDVVVRWVGLHLNPHSLKPRVRHPTALASMNWMGGMYTP